MVNAEASRFTVGVFQDVAWARRGLQALVRAGLAPESLSILVKDGPEAEGLIAEAVGAGAERLDLAEVGAAIGKGPLLSILQGSNRDLATLGLAGTLRRVGFQSHDSRIYERLTARGGVLVAVHSEPRASDALAVLLSYGGGNAAIGAWTGRV